MKIHFKMFDLRLRHTFTISRGSQDIVPILLIELDHEGISGFGEASPSSFYGQTVETVRHSIEAILPWLEAQNPMEYRMVLDEAMGRLEGNTAALCAIDLAMHDWVGKKLKVPLYGLLGLNTRSIPPTDYTIGIDTIPKMIAKMEEFADWPVFKIKLGTERDLEIIRSLREKTGAVFRVDANCGWDAQTTVEKSHALKDLGVEFIEQPMPPSNLDEMDEVYVESALPLIADENSVVPSDIPELAGRFHGINIKLVKCGGIQPALRMVALARAQGMRVMLGCMIESSCCCAAAAHLGAAVDYLDLDGPLLIGNDPFAGIEVKQGKISLSGAPGLGLRFQGRFE